LRTFTRADDVCLVVKDMGTRTFYMDQNFGDAFRRAAANPGAPEIIYLDEDLSESQLASLYRDCTCLVHPYRGEGFALPPLEAAALGMPSIVTAGGPTDDYLDGSSAYRLPFRRRYCGTASLGPFTCAGDPWQFDPDPQALAETMRAVASDPEDSRRRGEAAFRRLNDSWTWEATVADARTRLMEIVCPSHAVEPVPSVPWRPGKQIGAQL
jgi:glycosyltransferase involved in cell wall biosynthesis